MTKPVHIYRMERNDTAMKSCSQYSLTMTDNSQHNQVGFAWLAVKERLFSVLYTGTKNHEDIIENGMHKVCDSLWCLFYVSGKLQAKRKKDKYEKI